MKNNSLSRWKYRQVDCFVCASEAIREMLLADGVPEARALTVYEGIDLDRVAAAPPAELHADFWLPHDAPLVGNVAALVPHKGQQHLIDAAALVVQKVPDARFIIAGEGELRSALERQIKERRLEKHVFLAGFRPDVLSVHKAFDLFVMSSVTEGLGSSLLDAMACEKAIVATTAGRHSRGGRGSRHGPAGAAAGSRGDGEGDRGVAERRAGPAHDGQCRAAPRPGALQRRANGARHAPGLRSGPPGKGDNRLFSAQG